MANLYTDIKLFDAEYYLANNPDVAAAIEGTDITAQDHYFLHGAAENRAPNAWFNAAEYVAQNPDLADVDANLLLAHFALHGMAEDRAPNAATAGADGKIKSELLADYVNAEGNEDVKAAIAEMTGTAVGAELTAEQAAIAAQHFFNYGIDEDRKGGLADVIAEGEGVGLTEALAIIAEGGELPEGYTLSDADANFADQTVAGLADSIALANEVIAGATNAAELELNATYTLADTLENLTAAEAAVLEGAASYSLTDEAGDLGSLLTEEQIALVQGATNAADFTYGTIGETFTLTTDVDTVIGTSGNDTITGASGTVQDGDILIDQSTTDNDTANLVVTAAYTPSNITNIENVNLDWNAFGTASYDLDKVTGAKQVTLTSSKVGYLGDANVANAKGNTITAGEGTVGTLAVTGVTSAGATINADKAVGVSVTGTGTSAKATVNAGANTTSVTTNALANATIDAGKATTVNVTDVATSSQTTLTVNANAAITNVINGKLTLNAADGNKISLTNAIGTEMAVGGEGNVELTFAANALDAETLVNAKTAGTLTVKTADTNGEDVSKIQATVVEFTATQAVGSTTTVANGQTVKYSGAAGDIDIETSGDGKADVVNAIVTKNQNSLTVDSTTETLNLGLEAATLVSGPDLTITTLNLEKAAGATGIANKVVVEGALDLAVGSLVAADKANLLDATKLAGDLTVSTASNVQVSGGTGKLGFTSTGLATAGDEVAVVGQSGDDTVTANSMTVGALSAVLGDGKNTVNANSLTTGTLVVNSGSGVDKVSVGGSTVGAGTVSSGTVNLNLGNGDNEATVRTTGTSTAKVTVVTGDGADTVTLGGVTAAGASININTGAGADTLKLDNGTDLTLGTVTLAGIETIVINNANAATNATLQAATLSGQTFTVKGSAAGAADTGFTVVGKDTTTTIDLSGLTISRDVDSNVNAVTVNASAATQAVTITGTNVKDIITGSAHNDSITVSKGGSVITAGAGNDTINITQTTANQAADTIVFNTAATNGKDTIIGFKTGTDKLHVQDGDTTAGTASGSIAVAEDVAGALVTSAAAFDLTVGSTVSTSTNDVIELSLTLTSNGNLANALDGTELLKSLSTSTTAAATELTVEATGDKFFLVAYQNGNGYMYHVDAGADSAADAAEIALVGVLEGVTAGSLVAADFAIA